MSDYFPREILVEIFHRFPLKSLVRCTCVCKAWNSLITDQAFISEHLSRTIQASNGNGSLFLHFCRRIKTWAWPKEYEKFYSLHSDNQQIDPIPILRFPLTHVFHSANYSAVVGTCNGLVCFADYSIVDEASLVIWNPSIQKYVVLSKPIVTWSSDNLRLKRYRVLFGFGFDSKNKDYKLVRLVTFDNKEDSPQVEVYSLASRSWRSINVRVPPFLLSEHLWRIPQTFVNGVLHWVVSRRSHGQIHSFILSFDVVEETFGELMLPPHLKESRFELSVLQGGDSLAVVHTYSEDIHFVSVWVMKEYGAVESWTEVFHCDSKRYRGLTVLALRHNGEVVLRRNSGAVILIDPVKGRVKPLGHQKYILTFVGYYVKSLFLINKKYDVLSY